MQLTLLRPWKNWYFQQLLLLTTQVPVRDSKIDGTEAFAGKDSCSVVEISKYVFQVLVQLGTECKVIDKDDR